VYVTGQQQHIYRYSISANTWTSIKVQSASNGIGSTIIWNPYWSADTLLLIYGGGSSVVDQYSISGNSLTSKTIGPGTFAPSTYTQYALRWGTNNFVMNYNASAISSLYLVNEATLWMSGLSGDNYMSTFSTYGNPMCYTKRYGF
jgi:hypothetical protein